MHSTSNLKDGYIGSGTHLKYAIRKYGIDNFKIEILEWCDNRDELIKRERKIITEVYINDINCYNLKPGGEGGFNNKEHQFKCSQAAGLKHSERMKNDESYRLNYSKKISAANKRRIARGETSFYCDWTGKKHKEESIQKMKESKRGHGIGKQNSQYGLKWITDGNTNQKIKKDEPLPEKWKHGRISN